MTFVQQGSADSLQREMKIFYISLREKKTVTIAERISRLINNIIFYVKRENTKKLRIFCFSFFSLGFRLLIRQKTPSWGNYDDFVMYSDVLATD